MTPERLVSSISRDDVQAVVALMEGFACPWFISGGWAIDLFIGQVTRKHEDLEIGLARRDQARLHEHLRDWRLSKIVKGELILWQPGDRLVLPVHQIVAQQQGATPAEFEFLLNDVQGGEWRFRRDPSIGRPFDAIYLQTAQGIPVSSPDIQLLFKATWHQPKDEHDFHAALPYLRPKQRAWLKHALEVYRPGDPWLDELAQST